MKWCSRNQIDLKKRKILVAVTGDVSTDQRVIKTCNYLLNKNFTVIVFARRLQDTFEIDTEFKIVRKKLLFNNNFLFYAEYNFRLFWFLIFNKFDFIWSNDLDTLPSCYLGSKIKNSTLIYDSHEYFTEVPELQERKFVRNFWLTIEKSILPKLSKTITVNETIANEYFNKYGIQMQVVRNLPSKNRMEIDEIVKFPTTNNVILYQGVLNPGRGIKPVIESLNYISNIDLVIIGFGKVKEDLIEFVKTRNLENRVHFLGRIPPEKLYNYTKLADIGMVLEEPFGKSFSYSLPNKLFDFIYCETPIIASPINEVKSIIEKYKIGLVVDNFDSKHIAEKIRFMLENKDQYLVFKNNQKKIKDIFYWENDIVKIDKFFN